VGANFHVVIDGVLATEPLEIFVSTPGVPGFSSGAWVIHRTRDGLALILGVIRTTGCIS
jgi:hypothetical protein